MKNSSLKLFSIPSVFKKFTRKLKGNNPVILKNFAYHFFLNISLESHSVCYRVRLTLCEALMSKFAADPFNSHKNTPENRET